MMIKIYNDIEFDRQTFLKLRLNGEGALPDSVRALAERIDGDEIELKLEQGKHYISDVLEAIRDAGYRVQDVRTREPSLEDIFVELTADAEQAVVAA